MTTAQALENVLNAWVNGRKVRDGIPLTIRQQAEQALLTADAQATVEALQRERDELREMTKVICGHCCEPTAIPSKAILQAQLSQLQALVRALKGDANYTYHVADNPDEDDQYTVYVHVNGQGYGAIAEFYSRNEALAYAEIKRVATLPATPTGEAT